MNKKYLNSSTTHVTKISMFWSTKKLEMQATDEHCFMCFDVIAQKLNNLKSLPLSENHEPLPLFVTLTLHGKLRGCIGILSPVKFPQGLHEFAIKAAFQDSRFPPLRLSEFNANLTIGVSLLVNFEKGFKWNEWDLGIHGIVLTLMEYRAVFLPEVPKEQGWDHLQTIRALVSKSGYRGELTDSILQRISIERFTSSKSKATYLEWKQARGITE